MAQLARLCSCIYDPTHLLTMNGIMSSFKRIEMPPSKSYRQIAVNVEDEEIPSSSLALRSWKKRAAAQEKQSPFKIQ